MAQKPQYSDAHVLRVLRMGGKTRSFFYHHHYHHRSKQQRVKVTWCCAVL